MEYSVQTCRKGWIFFVEVHKVCGSFGIERMPPTLQLASDFWLRVLLSRKHERHVRSFVTERHSVREGILPNGPADISPDGFVDPRPRSIKGLMAKCLYHPKEFRFGPRAGHLDDKADDSRHGPISPRSPSPSGTCDRTRLSAILEAWRPRMQEDGQQASDASRSGKRLYPWRLRGRRIEANRCVGNP